MVTGVLNQIIYPLFKLMLKAQTFNSCNNTFSDSEYLEWHRFTLHNCFISFRTSHNVIRLDSQDFWNMRAPNASECPNLHFSKRWPPNCAFTTNGCWVIKWVWTDRTCVHLIFNHVTEFQHIGNTYRSLLVECLHQYHHHKALSCHNAGNQLCLSIRSNRPMFAPSK